uniref:Uncharacterized protein n=1 Tax=Globisporangium ultimum (strain ATCC 200006 / CBS 805.95 / DAOM BR144) TaxID=431595 RepID=K3WHL1_GLOUD
MEECGADDDLLERARRLCLAAQAISDAFPVFTRAVPQGNQTDEHTRDLKTGNTVQQRPQKQQGEKSHTEGKPQTERVSLAAPVKRKRSLKKQNSGLGLSNNQETLVVLPEIKTLSEEQRKARDAEKIRHAQERARARVSRTNQFDQMEAERELEIKRQLSLQQAEKLDEKEKLLEQSRLRAEERIRVNKQAINHVTAEKAQILVPEKPAHDPAKLKRFRRKTLARLQALPHTPNNPAPIGQQREPSETPEAAFERDEDHETERRQKEKKLRQETAERMRRLRAIEEAQKQKELELIEQGLQQFKDRQRELDRVAKGFGCQRKLNSVPKRQTPDPMSSDNQDAVVGAQPLEDLTDEEKERITLSLKDAIANEYISTIIQPDDALLAEENAEQMERPEKFTPTLEISIDDHERTILAASSVASGGRRKLPPWKRPPVPVLPTEFYSCKAVILPAAATPNECPTNDDAHGGHHTTVSNITS